ncbi:MAG: MG2 domain-containing protein [Proteobacteria bacterium]|nr:MG2 domain-containing protein [Pseudomonadota bacterium]
MFFRSIALAVCLLCSTLKAEFKFEEYIENSAKDFISDLCAEFPPAKEKEYEEAKKQLEKNFKAKKWAAGLNAARTILTHHEKHPEALISVAIFCYHANKQIKRANYEYSRTCQYAAYFAYQSAKTNLQKAQALLLYCTDNYAPNGLEEANKLYSIKKLREEDSRFKDIYKFKYENHNLEESPQGAILNLNFSQNLEITEPENYLEISPNVDGFTQVEGKSISISGFQSGTEYKVKIRPGIQSAFDEKIDSENEVSFFVNDLKPIIRFSNTYIYPKQEKILIPVRAINIDSAKVTLYRIPDRNIVNNLNSLMETSYQLHVAENLFSTKIDFNGKATPNQTITKNLDVTKSIPELKPGIYVLRVAQEGVLQYRGEENNQWFIVTDIGLTTFKSDQTLVVQARAFSSAKPLKNIQLELVSADNDILGTATTDSDGFAEFPKELLNGKAGKRPVAIFAKNEQLGFSFLSLSSAGFDFSDRGAKGRKIKNDYDVMIFCERGIYRPDEKVNVAAILRNAQGKEVPTTPLTFIVKTPKGTEIKRETINGDDLGSYHTEYHIPADCPVGMWSIEIFVDPTKSPINSTEFRVDDFSPNKMELSLTPVKKTVKPGETQKCTLRAHYLYGAPVDKCKAILEAKITTDHTPFTKWKNFRFGLEDDKFVSQVVNGTTSLITDGKTELTVDLPTDLSCSQALKVDLSARLADAPSSQQVVTTVNMLTQPYIVGIHEKETGTSKNIEIEIITVDCDGNLVSTDDLEYTFFKSEAHYQWYKDKGSWNYQKVFQDKPLDKGKIDTKDSSPTILSFENKDDAHHAIEIRQKDGTKVAKYHLGKQFNTGKDQPDNLLITPETKVVKLGEPAVLRVNAPFEGEATIISGLNSVQTKDTIHLNKGSNIVKVPTHESWGSGAYVLISLVRPLDKKITEIQPKRIVGLHWIQIDHKDSVLDVKLDLPEHIKPQSQLKVPVQIENTSNQKARLMIAIVDEGVIGLTNFTAPDPIKYFFGQRELGLEMRDVYGYIIDPVDADVIDIRSGGDGLMLRRGAFVPRINDKVLSFFDGDVHLNSEGKAEVHMDVPLFFGKLKVYAVAITKNKMGSQSGTTIVKDTLIVDPNLPIFLTVDDENHFNIRLENTSDQAIEFEISIIFEEALQANTHKETIKLDPKEQKNLRLKANAEQVGEGTVSIQAKGEQINYKHSTKVEVRPVYQPVLSTSMHEIKPNKNLDLSKEEILKGLNATKAEGDLFITNRGPWNFGKIQKWLLNYPFGCNQQIISKGFAAIFAIKQCKDDTTEASRLEYQRICYEIIELLNERQSSNGNWGMWPRESSYFEITSYAIEMLIYGQDCGLTVPKTMVEKAVQFAKNQINSIDWQIRDGRKKADCIAGFVKLCSQAKKIDTATTRYCFDEYFEKCDTPVGKALFTAAVASIQDLGRVKRGVKSLESAISKGITLDDAASIVAHLTPFKEIDIIEEMLQTLNKILQNGMNGDITKLNTQTLAMILKSNFGYAVPNSKKIKISVNEKSYNANSNLNLAIKPLDELAVQNQGDDSIWLFINAYGIPKEPEPTAEKGIKCTRTFHKTDGTKIDPQNMTIGERVVVIIEGKISAQENEGFMMLSEWLPAGFTHTNTTSNYEWLKGTTDNATIQKRHDRYIASWKQPAKSEEFKIVYEIIATHTGKFQHPGLHVENMINPSHYASYAPTTTVVQDGNGDSNEDEKKDKSD